MSAPTEAIERMGRSEPLSRPVMVSAIAHGCLFAAIALWSVLNAPFQLGDPNAFSGGAVTVNAVQGVPITVDRRALNPVANPVEHEVPAPQEAPKPPAPKPAEPEPKAVEVPAETKKAESKRPPQPKVQKSAPKGEENQLRSSTGAAANSPIFTGQQQPGAGGVGFGSGSPFGTRFGWYATALQRRVSEEWSKTLGQVQGGSPTAAVVVFRISRDGRIDDIQITQTSGNASLDFSARRAVTNVSPFQPLPAGLDRSSITVELWFELK
jgi:periplasmic protein TonB